MKLELASALTFVTHVIISSIIPLPINVARKSGYKRLNFGVCVAGPHIFMAVYKYFWLQIEFLLIYLNLTLRGLKTWNVKAGNYPQHAHV